MSNHSSPSNPHPVTNGDRCPTCDDPYDECTCYLDEPDKGPEGCVFGANCVCPHIDHTSDECATAEMMEAMDDAEQNSPQDETTPPAAVFCLVRPRPGWTCIENNVTDADTWCSMCVSRWNHNVKRVGEIPPSTALAMRIGSEPTPEPTNSPLDDETFTRICRAAGNGMLGCRQGWMQAVVYYADMCAEAREDVNAEIERRWPLARAEELAKWPVTTSGPRTKTHTSDPADVDPDRNGPSTRVVWTVDQSLTILRDLASLPALADDPMCAQVVLYTERIAECLENLQGEVQTSATRVEQLATLIMRSSPLAWTAHGDQAAANQWERDAEELLAFYAKGEGVA